MFGGGWEGGHAGCVGGDLGGAFWGHRFGLVGFGEGGLKGVGVGGGGGGEGAVCMCVCMGGVEVEVEVEEEDNVADFQDELPRLGI